MNKWILALVLLVSPLACSDIFLGEHHEPGFVQLNKTDDMFYWLFFSRDDVAKDPLVIWLTGGPGCSSEVAVFAENGPFSVQDDLTLLTNTHSWNNHANMLYVDQPLGTGYSKAQLADYTRSEAQIAQDFLLFLQGFLKKHPEFAGRQLFITGESYAGHYIPAISAFLHKQNDPQINLVGFAIGNGWTSPYQQYPAYNTFSYENKLIGTVQYQLLKAGFAACQLAIDTGVWFAALEVCQVGVTTILGIPTSPRFNVYDIREKCEHPPLCYDFSNVEKFLARADVQKALGVEGRQWQDCNMEVHTFLLGDWITDLSSQVGYLLDNGVKGLVYSGDKDFICNWRGGEAWTKAMKWNGQQEYNDKDYSPYLQAGKEVGQVKQTDSLVFLRVYDAGHMVPMNQPQVAVNMLDEFLGGWAKADQARREQLVE